MRTVHVDNVQAAAERDSHDHAEEQNSSQNNGAGQQEAGSSNGASGAGRSGGFGELGPIALSFAEDQRDRFGRCVRAAGWMRGVRAVPLQLQLLSLFQPRHDGTDLDHDPCVCMRRSDDGAAPSGEQPRSISSLTTEEWRARYERDGAVDLWVEEEFNSGSRLTVQCHCATCSKL